MSPKERAEAQGWRELPQAEWEAHGVYDPATTVFIRPTEGGEDLWLTDLAGDAAWENLCANNGMGED